MYGGCGCGEGKRSELFKVRQLEFKLVDGFSANGGETSATGVMSTSLFVAYPHVLYLLAVLYCAIFDVFAMVPEAQYAPPVQASTISAF